MVKVKKASGELEEYSENKVRASLKRAGADDTLIQDILVHIKDELFEGISTEDIYSHIFAILKGRSSHLITRYNLKRAIMELGPTGYPFEQFFAGVLKEHGYETKIDQTVTGECISHEIDIIAEKDGKRYMIECKFHNQPGTKSKIQSALYTYARFLDVQRKNNFNQAWFVTNTKVTQEVIDYGLCREIRIISWDYPNDFSLRELVEKSNLHPITTIDSLPKERIHELLEQGIVFAKDLTTHSLGM